MTEAGAAAEFGLRYPPLESKLAKQFPETPGGGPDRPKARPAPRFVAHAS
jgi:hypothetical protein